MARLLMRHPSGDDVVQQIQCGVANTLGNIPERAKKSPAHVLVIDDERLVRWAVAETLGARGYRISEAGDAKSAVQALFGPVRRADVILLDLFLPDSCDLHLLQFIRSRAPEVPVILMTAFATPEIVEQALAHGALVMSKPFDMSELARVVDRTLASRPS
jgi:DNA-binding NtrC family response regulator